MKKELDHNGFDGVITYYVLHLVGFGNEMDYHYTGLICDETMVNW